MHGSRATNSPCCHWRACAQMNKWRQLICPAIRCGCVKKTNPDHQLNVECCLAGGPSLRVNILPFISSYKDGAWRRDGCVTSSQCFLSFPVVLDQPSLGRLSLRENKHFHVSAVLANKVPDDITPFFIEKTRQGQDGLSLVPVGGRGTGIRPPPWYCPIPQIRHGQGALSLGPLRPHFRSRRVVSIAARSCFADATPSCSRCTRH